MEIISNNQFNILNIVKQRARFQKVMLLFDNTVSEITLMEIYSQIKGECIFNKMELNNLDKSELNNGYRLLIFVCSADSFLQAEVNTKNFINVFVPTDNTILPFYYLEGELTKENSYLVVNNNDFDFSVLPSILFNKVYNHLFKLYYTQTSDEEFDFELGNVTQKAVLSKLNALPAGMQFVDLQLIKEMKIDYKHLPIVDYLLITAFLCVVASAKERTLNMVDLYKVVKDDERLIDKYYALTCDGYMLNLITLNFNTLSVLITKTRDLILEYMPNNVPMGEELNAIAKKVEKFCCYGDTLLNYLFLFDCFG